MIIKCINEKCDTVLSVPNSILTSQINKGFKPIVPCSNCNTKMEIRPLKAACLNDNCGKTFQYYDFMLKMDNPFVMCPHCKKRIKVHIRKETKYVLNNNV